MGNFLLSLKRLKQGILWASLLISKNGKSSKKNGWKDIPAYVKKIRVQLILKTPVSHLSSLSAGLPPTTLSQRLDLGENQILSSLGVLLAGLSSAIHTGGGVEEIGVL